MEAVIKDCEEVEDKTKKCINPFCDFLNSLSKLLYDIIKYVIPTKNKPN